MSSQKSSETETPILKSRIYGTSGPPLLILHGLFGCGQNWHTQARALRNRFSVHTLDQRNHGRSFHAREMTYPLMAGDVRRYMDAHKLERAHVLGHSMGGKTAMALALAHPARIDHLVIADVAPKRSEPRYREFLDAMRSLDLPSLDRRSEADRRLRAAVPDTAIRRFLLKNLVPDENGAFRWRVNLAAIDRAYETIFGAPETAGVFPGPALFLRGARSSFVTADDMPAILDPFPGARLQTIENAGHWIHTEQPDAFLDAVRTFLP